MHFVIYGQEYSKQPVQFENFQNIASYHKSWNAQTSLYDFYIYMYYRNFRTFTRTADYPQRSIFVVRGKKVQQITRTPKQKKILLLYYRDKNSQTWSDEYSVLLFTKRKIDNIFC